MEKPLSIIIFILGAILLELSAIYYALRTGMALHILDGGFFIPVFLLLYIGIGSLLKRFSVTRHKAIIIKILFSLTLPALNFAYGYEVGTPKAMFERFVIRPMPESVRDFKWSGGVGIDGYYFLSFKASPEDVLKIIEKRHLVTGLDLPEDYYRNRFIETNQPGIDPVNYRVSKFCSSAGWPFQNLESPVLYRSTNFADRSIGTGWKKELFTDGAHQQVYLHLH